MDNKQIEMTLSIPQYSREHGIRIDWVEGFEITVTIMNKETVITANKLVHRNNAYLENRNILI